MNDRTDASGPQLPVFSGGGGSAPQLPDHSGGRGGGQSPDGPRAPEQGPGGSGGGGRNGLLFAALLGGAGCLTVVIIVVALVLSQTLFGTDPEEPSVGPETSSTQEEDPGESRSRPPEYIPTEEQTDEAEDGDITFAEQPTVACTIHENTVATEQVEGVVRGGGLEFAHLEGWEVGTDWSGASAYQVDQSWAHQPVENGWYTATSVGAVDFPEEEGGYPGAQETARAIFQCGLSREDAQEIYDDPVELKDYREEPTTIDGHPAWIVSADVQLADGALFHTTDAWRLVVIVVDTPEGPAAFDGGAAIGHAQQATDLEAMIESLRVY